MLNSFLYQYTSYNIYVIYIILYYELTIVIAMVRRNQFIYDDTMSELLDRIAGQIR